MSDLAQSLTSLVLALFSLYSFCLFTYVVFLLFIKVKLGKPPSEKLFVAYKYAIVGLPSYDDLFFSHKKLFPTSKGIKICYSGLKPNQMEVAYGMILNGSVRNLKKIFPSTAFSLFVVPEVEYGMYVVIPVAPFLGITRWLGVAISYMKIFSMTKKEKLCGYPIMEIYDKYTLTIIVPLSQQDDYIVKEAEGIMHRGYVLSEVRRCLCNNMEVTFEKSTQLKGT